MKGTLTMSSTVERRWPGDPGAQGGKPNRVGFTYRAYLPDEIRTWQPDIGLETALLASDADGACRSLQAHADTIGVLSVPLLRSEAVASSRIEGLAVSHHRLSLAQAKPGADVVANHVVANVRALQTAIELAGRRSRLLPSAILEIHALLLPAEGHSGRFREVQNWIGGRHPNPRGAAFIPPPEDNVPALVKDLCLFIDRDDLPATIQAAIVHAQFETIHPFVDGNGRVGRALIQLVLQRRGVTSGPRPVFPPVSLVIGGSTDAYVAGLTAYRAGDLDAWLRYLCEATITSARLADQLALEVSDLQDHWREQVGRPRRGSATEAVIAALPSEPVIDSASVQRIASCSDRAAKTAVNRLLDGGVIKQIGERQRGRRFEAVGLFALLDDLEHGITGRRRRRNATSPPAHGPASASS